MMFTFQGCQEIGEYYLGLNQKPELFEQEPLHGLNVYGILKTGPGFDTLNHFFEVQQMLPIGGMYDSLVVTDAHIDLIRTSTENEQQHYQLQHLADGRYSGTDLIIAPGDVWTFYCKADTFEVTATSRIPKLPELEDEPVAGEDGILRFAIAADTTAFLHQVYVLNGDQFYTEKKVAPGNISNAFSIQLNQPLNETLYLYVFAYDENLERYQSTSNTFFKPNAYRPPFSTVDGGYGTFGAVSSSRFEVSR
jgi:hypothetical protein